MSTEQANKLWEMISNIEPFTDERLAEIRQALPGMNTLGISSADYASLRVSIELLASLRRFDQTSGDLVTTTNLLTATGLRLNKIGLWLGGAAIVLAAAALAVSIIALMK